MYQIFYLVNTGSCASITLIRRNIRATVVPSKNTIRSNAVRNREGKYGLPRTNDRRISSASASRNLNLKNYR